MEVTTTDINGVSYTYQTFREAYNAYLLNRSICRFSRIEFIGLSENRCYWYPKQKFNRWSTELEQAIEFINSNYKRMSNNSETVYWVRCAVMRNEIKPILPTNPRSVIEVINEAEFITIVDTYPRPYESRGIDERATPFEHDTHSYSSANTDETSLNILTSNGHPSEIDSSIEINEIDWPISNPISD